MIDCYLSQHDRQSDNWWGTQRAVKFCHMSRTWVPLTYVDSYQY